MGYETVNERSQHLLKVLVERYIREGQPVGSRTLAEDAALSLSPATIRNVMAELEELGYLHSPHTSAGRVPTAQAYRFFVDSLLTMQPLEQMVVQQLQQQLDAEHNTQSIVNKASAWLSGITRLMGLITLPKTEHMLLRQVEFLPLSERRVLAILVLNDQEIQNRIIETDRNYSREQLQQTANFLNAHFAGQDLQQVKKQLIKAMHEEKAQIDSLMQATLDVADKAFNQTPASADYVVAGQTHLLDLADATGIQRLRSLFEAFVDKRDMAYLLEQCLNTEGVQIYIGEESGHALLEDCSMITAPYKAEGKVVGVLGVIGPTRMAYDHVISVVDVTARLLSAALNQAS